MVETGRVMPIRGPMSRLRLPTLRTGSLFAAYAVLSALPVLALGLVLADGVRREALRRGLEEGRSVASVIASTAVDPLRNAFLAGHDVLTGLPNRIAFQSQVGLSPSRRRSGTASRSRWRAHQPR